MTSKFSNHADRTDTGRAPRTSLASSLLADQLRLSGHMLQALECGQVPMNAAGYMEVVNWVRGELEQLSTSELHRLRWRVPGSIRCVVENVLHARREPTWATACGSPVV